MATHTSTLQLRMPTDQRQRLLEAAGRIGLREAALARNALRLGLDVIEAAERDDSVDLPLEATLRDIVDQNRWRVAGWETVEV